MSSTSTNFSLTLATGSDQVNVDNHVAGVFSTLDSILGIAHTGTGQLKASLSLTTPTLINPTISGTATGGTIVATTGKFNTITATGGAITALSSFGIGTYTFPTVVGSTNQVLSVQTGNVVFVSPSSGGTGAGPALDNLAAVAINTNLNTFTAGFVTVARVVATSGNLTGLTAIAATTATLGGLTVTGTASIPALIGVTGGTATFSGLAIGTWSFPATIGSTGQVLKVTTGNAVWLADSTGPNNLIYMGSFTASAAALQLDVSITANKFYKGYFDIEMTTTGSPTNWAAVLRFDTNGGNLYWQHAGGTATNFNSGQIGVGVYLSETGNANWYSVAAPIRGELEFSTFVGSHDGTAHSSVFGKISSVGLKSSGSLPYVVNTPFQFSTAVTITGFNLVALTGTKMAGTVYLWRMDQT